MATINYSPLDADPRLVKIIAILEHFDYDELALYLKMVESGDGDERGGPLPSGLIRDRFRAGRRFVVKSDVYDGRVYVYMGGMTGTIVEDMQLYTRDVLCVLDDEFVTNEMVGEYGLDKNGKFCYNFLYTEIEVIV